MTVHPAGVEGLRWVQERAPCVLTRDARAIEARTPDGRITGVVAFDCPTPNSMQMHVAIESPIAIRALKGPVFQYAFAEREIVYGVVRASNRRALIFDTRLGFKQVARLRDGWAKGEDVLLLELRKEDYRG